MSDDEDTNRIDAEGTLADPPLVNVPGRPVLPSFLPPNFAQLSAADQISAMQSAMNILRLAQTTADVAMSGVGQMPPNPPPDSAGVDSTAADPATGGQPGGSRSPSQSGGSSTQQPPAAIGTTASLLSRTTDMPDDEIGQSILYLPKSKREAEGTKVGNYQRDLACTPLSTKFDVLVHQSRYSTGGESTLSAQHSIQKQLTTIIQLAKLGHKHCSKFDFADICHVPVLLPNTSGMNNPQNWWDLVSDKTNIWEHWEVVEENTVKSWQYTLNKRGGNETHRSNIWLLTFLEGSCSLALREKLDRKVDSLPNTQRGGVIYLWYLLNTLFSMNRDVKKACVDTLENWSKTGATAYVGENFYDCEEDIIAICTRLDACDSLEDDMVIQVYKGCGITSHAGMKKLMEQLAVHAEFDKFDLLEGVNSASTNLDKCKGIFKKATEFYDVQCKLKHWNVSNKGGGKGRVVNACFNCGGDHGLHKCDKPKDDAEIKKNKAAFEKKKKAEKAAGKDASGDGNGEKKNGKKGDKITTGPNYQRKKFGAAAINQGIVMVNGIPHLSCKKCNGVTSTHGSKHHDAWASSPATFTLPATHPLAMAQAKLATTPAVASPAPSSPAGTAATVLSTASSAGSAGSFISRELLSQRVDRLERTSTNPNAATYCSLMRELLKE